ncbi:hypothetical protein C2S52_022304 [Perilla frutescens var. hirtella]|nr:hypothetical protein C2S52_022304 [Perilla frutescens var. hirtella]
MDFDLNESLHNEDFACGNRDLDEGQSSEYKREDPESVHTLIVDLEAKLRVGNIYNTAEEVIRIKEYVCSCWGWYEEKKGIHRLMDYKKQIYRTGCKARLRIYKGKDSPWKVAIFNKDHNHELVPHIESYLLRSACNLSLTKKTLIEALNLAEIGVSRAYRFMVNEADSSFTTARHRLCQCHINLNAPSHFGSLNGNKAFKSMWHKCMNSVDTEAEFDRDEQKSRNLRTEQNQISFEHRCIANMYKLRKRWASIFTHSYFSVVLHPTSRNNGMNKTFKDMCSAKSSFSHFVKFYEQIQADWRVMKSTDNACDIGVPG